LIGEQHTYQALHLRNNPTLGFLDVLLATDNLAQEFSYILGSWWALAYRDLRLLGSSLSLLARVFGVVTFIRKIDFNAKGFPKFVDT
jgi:hypothetical protein